ncbi:NAD-dependent epimerase/dehydratase family protein [Magnetofaba australis]|uniref:NAD-dependent epimerase/dehydratase family protein n=1 Tax=Magnetofaba australis TaxID=1472297 RepID=UPI000A19F57C|nr:NAD(P)-dependent oxidoreductase [Magnetofaba australis]
MREHAPRPGAGGQLLITGAGGGLGKYLFEQLGGVALTRQSPPIAPPPAAEPFAAIIHCAFNMRRDLHAGDALYGYLQDTLFLTQAMTALPHRRFILISSVDVYPQAQAGRWLDETTPIPLDGPLTPYALCKLAAESIVAQCARNSLILRPGLLLGPHMRPNNLTRLACGAPGALSLTADSEFRCAHYADILAFIRLALTQPDIHGVFNAHRSDAVSMGALAERFGRQRPFGAFTYRPPPTRNDKIARLCPVFAQSSMQAVERLVQERETNA